MAAGTSHIIKSQIYRLFLEQEQGATTFHDRVSNINELRITPMINRILDDYEVNGEAIYFSSIELNLGALSKENFEEELQYRIEEELRYFLDNNLKIARHRKSNSGENSETLGSVYENLSYYLRKGQLRWNHSKNDKPEDLLLEWIENESDEARRKMLALGKEESVRKRLIFQFKEQLLEKLTRYIEPNNGSFIIDFKVAVVHQHEKNPIVSVSPKNFRNAVWEIILEYLFSSNTNYSNRKALLKYLLEKTAQRHGLQYHSLLLMIVDAMKTVAANLTGEIEFHKILNELNKEAKKQDKAKESIPLHELEFEEKLRYFFTHGSLPVEWELDVEHQIWNFIRNNTAEARIFFRNLFKANKGTCENLMELLSNNLLVEIIKLVDLENIRKWLYYYDQVFENRAEGHFISSELLQKISPLKAKIVISSYLFHTGNNKQLLFSLLMTIKRLIRIDNASFLRLLAGAQQILPSGFNSELDQLRQFIVLPAGEFKNEIPAPEAKLENIGDENLPAEQASIVYRQKRLYELLMQWYEYLQRTSDLAAQSNYLWILLSKYAQQEQIAMKELLIQTREELHRMFNELIPNWQFLVEQISHKNLMEIKSDVPQDSKEGMQEMLHFIREQLKRSFDALETLPEFITMLEMYAQQWKIEKTELMHLLRQAAKQENYPESERMQLFFDGLENELSEIRISPQLMRQAHMNELESKHHQLRKIVFDLRKLLQNEHSNRKFEMRLFDIIVALSRELKLSRLLVVQELLNTLAWSIPEGDARLEAKLQQALEQFGKQVKDSRFTSDLIHYYLSEKALPWWAAGLTENDLKRHASLFVSLFPNQLRELYKKKPANMSLLFQWMDNAAKHRAVEAVWGNLPRKFRIFHHQLGQLMLQHYGAVRVSFENLYANWHFRLWKILTDTRKTENIDDFTDLYLQLLKDEMGIEAQEVMELLQVQLKHPYFDRLAVKKTIREVLTRNNQANLLQPLDWKEKEAPGTESLTEILARVEKHRPVKEEELYEAIEKLIGHSPERYQAQLKNAESRRKILAYLSERNREKLAFSSLNNENRNDLEKALKIIALFKATMTTTQYQQLLASFYELYFLKLSVDKPTTWKLKDWSVLISNSFLQTFQPGRAEKILWSLKDSPKTRAELKGSEKMFELVIEALKTKPLPVKKAGELLIPEKIEPESRNFEQEELFLPASGLILIAPFLPRLFELLSYMKDGQFGSDEDRNRAVYALYFAAYGRMDAEEWELGIPKLLCGMELESPVYMPEELDESKKEIVESLLRAVIDQWTALKQTSTNGLREAFLQREAKLTINEDFLTLQVKQQTIDILIDRIPWSISKVKFSWMPKMIQVEWR